jgi:L-ascorbate metabolism protein UlaG (beta-lactamase superfamily)
MVPDRRMTMLAGALIAALVLTAPDLELRAQSGKAEVLWLGQAAFKITTPGGKVIVLDPFLVNNPKTPAEYKDLDKLGKVDLILITHGHGDHVGDVKALAAKTGAKVYGPAGLIATLIDLGWVTPEQGVRFGKGGKVQPLGPQITVTQVRAEHSSEVTVTDPATKKSTTHPGGEPAGFVIQLENGFKIYHMGDTGIFGDMKLIAEYYRPDLVLMPIGGHFVMDPKDAAFATREWLKPKFVIPMHYGTFPVLKGTPQEYLTELGQTTTKVFAINPGDKLEF